MKNPQSKPDNENLRKKAEDLMKTSASLSNRSSHALSETDTLKLVHELQVYQIELEMQNEELIQAKELAAKHATEKYAALYDFAPI